MIINPADYGTLIGIDHEVFDVLTRRARPFVDDPNAVLRRELGIDKPTDATTPLRQQVAMPRRRSINGRKKGPRAPAEAKPPRAPKGSLTPEEAFEEPLLRALDDAGGQLASREALARVGEAMSGILNDEDRFQDDKGVARWEKRVPFVRLKLVERGLMSKDSRRGTWQITDAGRLQLTRSLAES